MLVPPGFNGVKFSGHQVKEGESRGVHANSLHRISSFSATPGVQKLKMKSISIGTRGKDGVSIIHELNRTIEIGMALGHDMTGCSKTLESLVKGIDEKLVDR